MATGKGGVVVRGSVQGSTIITGDGNVIQSAAAQPVSHEARQLPSASEVSQALTDYRRLLVSACSRLPLRGIDIAASDPTGRQQQLHLDQVYVNLDTQTQVQVADKEQPRRRQEAFAPDRGKSPPLSALEAAAQNRCVVLLGDPGSGKSTFLNHLALCLALNDLEPANQWLRHLPGWPGHEGSLLPIPVVRRDFIGSLGDTPAQAQVRHLWDFIAKRLREQKLESAEQALPEALQDGRALVLLDGPAETAGLRQLLRQTNRSDVDLKRRLYRLACEAHRAGGAGPGDALADISESALESTLAELHPQRSLDWAKERIVTIKLRAGLLLERAPQVYTFPHRTFQEYLAGAHLATQANFATEATRLVGEGAFWREVLLLAVGKLVYLNEDIDKPVALAAALCPETAMRSELGWRKVWLA
ncbi:MAG: hypothetical protein HY674_10335, partial [Chloroflexi bacterium]|nr:hypothetical protein [Chloroflexota bacterium]